MNIVGLDYGEKRVGVAFSQGSFAQTVGSFATKEAITRLKKFCQDKEIDLIVIGLPEGRLRSKIRQFGQSLESELKIKIEYWDETLSTKSAHSLDQILNKSRKKRRQQEHSTSAALILQSYLDEKTIDKFV